MGNVIIVGAGWQLPRVGGCEGERRPTSESCQNVKFQNGARRSNFKRAPTVGMQCTATSNIVIAPWYPRVNIHASHPSVPRIRSTEPFS